MVVLSAIGGSAEKRGIESAGSGVQGLVWRRAVALNRVLRVENTKLTLQ